jgi:histone H4
MQIHNQNLIQNTIRSAFFHRRYIRDNLKDISKADIRCLARCGGVKRLSKLVYNDMRDELRNFLQRTIRTAVTYTEHSYRKSVSALDIVHSLKQQGNTLYGFDRGQQISSVKKREPKK